MILSSLANSANHPDRLRQLQKLCDCHNHITETNTEIDLGFDVVELDKAIKSAIDKTMDRYFGK